jgi:hypothetical protein
VSLQKISEQQVIHRFVRISLLACLVFFNSCASRAPRQYVYQPADGGLAILRDGRRAYAPKRAPAAVHRAVEAGNRLQRMPYRYGGGHARIDDSGYDCSGAVSYVLIQAGLLRSPMTSKGFRDYGRPGPGKWITIWASKDHSFVTVGGLRLDTGWLGAGDERGPRWKTGSRPTRRYVLRHPRGL